MSYDEKSFAEDLSTVLVEVQQMLLQKNAAYGDSALEPVQLFSKGLGKDAGIRVRIDDKLSRLSRGSAAGEDVEHDLLGYLVLLRIAKLRAARHGEAGG